MIDELNQEQLSELWPKDESGALAARLIQRFLLTHGTETAMGATCTAERAQAEAAANKAIANLTKIFGALTVPAAVQKPRKLMKPLHRFTAAQPAGTTPETK